MNTVSDVLTIDVEEWFHGHNYLDQVPPERWAHQVRRVEANTDRLLELLDRYGTRATFFVLGWIAERHPDLVRRIAAAGHEIGCHSFAHPVVFELTPEAFLQDLDRHLLAARMTVADRPVYVLTTRWTPSPQADRGRLLELVDAYDGGQLAGAEFAGRVTDAVAGRERRLAEARETLVYANALAGEEPVILLGSFYALPDSPEIALLRDAGFVDVWRSVGRSDGFTRDGRTNANLSAHGLAAVDERARYDYIFVRGAGIAPRSARLILDRPTFGVHPSAHYGVLADIRVDPR